MSKEILTEKYRSLENEIKDLQLIRELIKETDKDDDKIEKVYKKIDSLIYEMAEIIKEV